MSVEIPIDRVSEVLRVLADEHMLPWFRRLRRADIEEKAPGELVTAVDRDMEQALCPHLMAMLPGSRVVGEESVADVPALLDGLDQGDVWLVDPLDGTRNFTEGRPDFAAMVALLRDGEPIASWIWAPIHNRLTVAERGAGAWLNGGRLRAAAPGPKAVAVVKPRFLPEAFRTRLTARASFPMAEGSGAAGIDYPDLLLGRWRYLLFWRTLPWDHAPGSLLVEEAGGRVARLSGRRYRVGDPGTSLLVAADAEHWTIAAQELPSAS